MAFPDASPAAYVQYLSNRFGLPEMMARRREGQSELEVLQKGFSEFSKIFGLSLRHQEQAMAEVNFILRRKPINTHISAPLIGMMAVLKRANQSVYEGYCKGPLIWNDLGKVIENQPYGREWLANKETLLLRGWLLIGNHNDDNKLAARHSQFIARLNEITNSGSSTEALRKGRETLEAKNELISRGLQIARFLSKYDLMEGRYSRSPVGIVYDDFNLARDYSA